MDGDKNEAIINRIIKAGGRHLPGMVPSSSVPDSAWKSGGEELTVRDNYVDFMEWWLSEEPWKELEHPKAEDDDEKAFTKRAENLKRALYVFDHLLLKQETILQDHIKILQELADNTDKEMQKGVIGATVAALGLAVSAGTVIIAPWTSRTSLAVGALFAAVGVSAPIITKIHTRKKVEKKVEIVLKEHFNYIEEIERCVKFIDSNVEYLKKYDLSHFKWVRVARVAHMAGDSVKAIGPLSKSSGLIQGFRLGMDIYFIKDDSEQLKKGSETKFAKQIRMLAKQMQGNLDELMKFKKVVESADRA